MAELLLELLSEEMYGKLMSISDAVMLTYYPLVSGLGPDEVGATTNGVRDGTVHPMAAKKRLARLIVARFHGEPAARAAEEAFTRQFQAREVPGQVPEVTCPAPPAGVTLRMDQVLLSTHLASSASEARRLILQGGMRLDGDRVQDPYRTLRLRPGDSLLVQRGHRGYARLRVVAAPAAETPAGSAPDLDRAARDD